MTSTGPLEWTIQPHVGVGPLRFGMGFDAVTALLGPLQPSGVRFVAGEAIVYFDDGQRLNLVELPRDAFPWVTLEGYDGVHFVDPWGDLLEALAKAGVVLGVPKAPTATHIETDLGFAVFLDDPWGQSPNALAVWGAAPPSPSTGFAVGDFRRFLPARPRWRVEPGQRLGPIAFGARSADVAAQLSPAKVDVYRAGTTQGTAGDFGLQLDFGATDSCALITVDRSVLPVLGDASLFELDRLQAVALLEGHGSVRDIPDRRTYSDLLDKTLSCHNAISDELGLALRSSIAVDDKALRRAWSRLTGADSRASAEVIRATADRFDQMATWDPHGGWTGEAAIARMTEERG